MTQTPGTLYDMDGLFDSDKELTIDGSVELEAETTPQASILAVQQCSYGLCTCLP